MTLHMDHRMNHRGITRELVNLTLEHGDWDGDRCVLNRKSLLKMIENIDRQRALAMRALDKGGTVVVEADGKAITTYNLPKVNRSRH